MQKSKTKKVKKRITKKMRANRKKIYFLSLAVVIAFEAVFLAGRLAGKEIESNAMFIPLKTLQATTGSQNKTESQGAAGNITEIIKRDKFEPETKKDFELINNELLESAKNYTVIIPELAGSLAKSNNNPCNLTYAKQPSATKSGRFAKFISKEAGARACYKQIALDQSRELSLTAFINKYAPSHENNTKLYLSFLCDTLGASPDTKINTIPALQLVQAVAKFESQSLITLK